MEALLLQDIVIVCGLAIGVILLCHRLRVPPAVGFFVTGIIAGPHGSALVSRVESVEHLAEMGVICLLFTIGLEFSFRALLQMRYLVVVGGGIQIMTSAAGGTALGSAAGMPLHQAVFIGFLVSLSSTAIVLRLFQERAEIETPHGRLGIGILLCQDLAVIPMMLLTPVLSGAALSPASSLPWFALKLAGVCLVTVAAARWLVPTLLFQAARIRGSEVFLLAVVCIGLGVAWMMSRLGLSPAIGAFLAGLIIAESEFAHQALGDVLPFRDLFTSFFFVSIGMLLDVSVVMQQPLLVASLTVFFLLLKSTAAAGAGIVLGYPLRTAVLAGLALGQIGEFSFVLSKAGEALGLIDPGTFQLFLAASIFTMIVTPFFIVYGDIASRYAVRLPFPDRWKSGFRSEMCAKSDTTHENHLIIVGYGLNGRNLSAAARTVGIPYVIIELNPTTVRKESSRGRPIFSGDASHAVVLEHAGARQARVMVIVISDSAATRRIIASARRLNPGLHIIARSRFVTEAETMKELGADEVIPEDFETSMEILARVLTKYLVSGKEIEDLIGNLRADHYGLLRGAEVSGPSVCDLGTQLPDMEIATVRVAAQSVAVGKSLQEMDLRGRYGVTVLAIKSPSGIEANPAADERLRDGESVILLGKPEDIANVAENVFSGS